MSEAIASLVIAPPCTLVVGADDAPTAITIRVDSVFQDEPTNTVVVPVGAVRLTSATATVPSGYALAACSNLITPHATTRRPIPFRVWRRRPAPRDAGCAENVAAVGNFLRTTSPRVSGWRHGT